METTDEKKKARGRQPDHKALEKTRIRTIRPKYAGEVPEEIIIVLAFFGGYFDPLRHFCGVAAYASRQNRLKYT